MLIKAISIKKENKPPYLIESPAYWPIITGPPRFRGEINPWTIFFKKKIQMLSNPKHIELKLPRGIMFEGDDDHDSTEEDESDDHQE